MKTKDNIKDILSSLAESHGLTLIETTSEANGYPAHPEYAVIGFDSFGQAEKLAAEYGLRIEEFVQRNGWGLWHRTGNAMHGPYELDADDCWEGDAHEAVGFETSEDVSDFFLDDFNGDIDWKSLDDVFRHAANVKAVADMVKELKDDEMVVCSSSAGFPEIRKIHVMQYTNDMRTRAIGLIAP